MPPSPSMSALPPIADICSAQASVRYVPIADIVHCEPDSLRALSEGPPVSPWHAYVEFDPRSFGQPTSRTARNHQSVAIVAAMVRPVRVSIVAVVSVPIRAPMYPAINTGNAPWSEGTANHS